MPRHVNREERRQELASAVLDVIAEHGLEATTVRRIAVASGLSTGALSHYFTSKDELVQFALTQLFAQVHHRVRRAAEGDGDPYERLQQMVDELLPLDRQRRMEAHIWMMLLGAALPNRRVRDIGEHSGGLLGGVFADVLRECQAAGRIRADVDADREAAYIIALLAGVSVQTRNGRELSEMHARFVPDHLATLAAAHDPAQLAPA